MKYKGTSLERILRYLYLRFIRLHGTAEDVARGLALGIFIGMTPTMGIQMPIAFFFAMLLKENKIAAVLGVWISNPATFIPLYTFNFQVGKYLLGTSDLKMPDFSSLREVMALGHDFLLPLVVGSLVAGVVVSTISYPIFLNLFRAIKAEREKLKRQRILKRKMKKVRLEEEKD